MEVLAMYRKLLSGLIFCAVNWLVISSTAEAAAITHAFRGASQTTFFGWDVFERVDPPTGPMGSYLLNDSSPDIGINPGGANVRQNNSLWGNISGTGNLYSGFFPGAVFDLTVTAPTSGIVGPSGWTTVVFQLLENGGTPLLPFTLNGLPPVESASFDVSGRVQHAYEWHVAGNESVYQIHIASLGPHAAIDTIVFDTVYTSGSAPIDVAVPEPATWLIAAGGVLLAIWVLGGFARRGKFLPPPSRNERRAPIR
jgi:hypothetical protein